MDLKTLQDTPPWEWPEDAGKTFQQALLDRGTNASSRLVAAELAGDLVVMNDDLAAALMKVLSNPAEPEKLRAKAAISLGPALEISDTDGFENPDDVPITESTFRGIQELLQKLYFDTGVPKQVRRRILEASVRAAATWHQDAIRVAYFTGDRDWVLTAVFAMRWVRGFDDQILEALKSKDPETHSEAVEAAGNWGLEAAWPHVAKIVSDPHSAKPLRLAAIGAVATIRPEEAIEILEDLAESDDEEIAEAVEDAIAMARGASDLSDDEEDEEDEKGEEWVN